MESAHDSEDPEFEIPIINCSSSPSWSPPKKSFAWLKKKGIADYELTNADIKSLKEEFSPPEEVKEFFTPPLLPDSIYSELAECSQDDKRQAIIKKIQSLSTLALMPLLSLLELTEPKSESQALAAKTIQILCHTNLQLSRLRRTLVARFVNPEIRKAMYSQPITHSSFFGTDWSTSADAALKARALSTKLVNRPPTRIRGSTSSNSARGSYGRTRPHRRSYPERPQFNDFVDRGNSNETPIGYPRRSQSFRPSRGRSFSHRGRSRFSSRGRGNRSL